MSNVKATVTDLSGMGSPGGKLMALVAVSLDDSEDDSHLALCQASAETLAISYVWSHGQGGTHEEGFGFNRC